MQKIKITLPLGFKHKGYYGVIDNGIYTIDPEYKNDFEYKTLEKVNNINGPSRGT